MCSVGSASSSPKVKPSGYWANSWPLAATCAKICGCFDFDVEPGPQYWHAIDFGDYHNVVPLFRRVRELAPNAELTLDFPGSWAWDPTTPLLQSAAPYADRIAIQSYWTPTVATNDQAKPQALGLGKPLEHIAITGHLPQMLAWLVQQGATRVGATEQGC